MQLCVFFLLFLVVVTVFHQVQASNFGSFSRKQVGIYPTMNDGICASSVIVHGYKCQEIQVIVKLIYDMIPLIHSNFS